MQNPDIGRTSLFLPQLCSPSRDTAIRFGLEKLEMCGYRRWKFFEHIFIRLDRRHERDRHTDTTWRHRLLLCVENRAARKRCRRTRRKKNISMEPAHRADVNAQRSVGLCVNRPWATWNCYLILVPTNHVLYWQNCVRFFVARQSRCAPTVPKKSCDSPMR